MKPGDIVHDDDEKNTMEKQLEELRRALKQVDPEMMR
jgi:hypothetical protein